MQEQLDTKNFLTFQKIRLIHPLGMSRFVIFSIEYYNIKYYINRYSYLYYGKSIANLTMVSGDVVDDGDVD
jgi:hypothetical protein